MQAKDIAALVEEVAAPEVSPEAQETAARISALLRHLFLYDRGNLLRVIEESGLTMTQSKALLELGGLGEATEARQVSDLAEALGVSVPSMSRAVDGLVRKPFDIDMMLNAVRKALGDPVVEIQPRQYDAQDYFLHGY